MVWAYSLHLQFGTPIPADIEVILEFLRAKSLPEKKIYNWELELLTREVIINAQNYDTGSESLRRWAYFAGAINKIKNLENELSAIYVNKKNILMELFRIAHRQFPWQLQPNREYMYRYYRIFSNKDVDDIIFRKIQVKAKDLFLAGSALLGHYLTSFFCGHPIKVDIPGLNEDIVNKLIELISIDLNSLREIIRREHLIDEKFAYNTYILKAYPLIKNRRKGARAYFCPLPTTLYWRFTSGIYYEVCKERGFDNAFGKSFQNYVGQILERANKKMTIYPEQSYGPKKKRKNSIDWIIDGGDSALFIECKTKRMTVPAKIELSNTRFLDKELKKITDFVVQVYKTIKDYFDNKYTHFSFQEDRKIYPLIVTLDDLYFFHGPIEDRIRKNAEQEFQRLGLPIEWLDKLPYSICSIHEFEQIAQIIQIVGIKRFMDEKLLDSEKRAWHFGPFIATRFPEEAKKADFLFKEDFDKILFQELN